MSKIDGVHAIFALYAQLFFRWFNYPTFILARKLFQIEPRITLQPTSAPSQPHNVKKTNSTKKIKKDLQKFRKKSKKEKDSSSDAFDYKRYRFSS